jgi:AraC-like DNA-binding protein
VLWRATRSESALILPDGCIDIILSNETITIAGPATRSFESSGIANSEVVGLRFLPGYAPELLGVPANELRDHNPLLAEILPRVEAAGIESRLRRPRSGSAATELTAIFASKLADADRQRLNRTRFLTARVEAGIPISQIAAETGYSERQLHRLSTVAFGYGLRTLNRILRFQCAIGHLQTTQRLGAVATLAGYSDQAHLSRDTAEFAGLTPAALRTKLRGENQTVPPSGDINQTWFS